MAIAGVATELLGLTPWHMPAPMRAHARAFSSSSAPAGPLPLWLSLPTHMPHRVYRARRCHHARHSHRTTVPHATHTLATCHTLAGCARPVCCRLSLRLPRCRAPTSRRLLSPPRRPFAGAASPPASLAVRTSRPPDPAPAPPSPPHRHCPPCWLGSCRGAPNASATSSAPMRSSPAPPDRRR